MGHKSATVELPGLDAWENSSRDWRFRLRGPTKRLDDRIVIVGLDTATKRSAPELWQTRRGFSELVSKIDASNPRALGIDAFFASPEIVLPAKTIEAVRAAQRALEETPDLSPAHELASSALRLVDDETHGDDIFANAVADSDKVVLALLFYLQGTSLGSPSPEPPGLAKARFDESVHLSQPPSFSPPQASGVAAPLPPIAKAAASLAHVNVHHDTDGAVRSVPFVIEQDGRYYPSLALKLASIETNQPTSYVAGDSFVRLGKRKLKLTTRTFGRIAYLGPSKVFPRVSALEVMRHDGPHPALRDKIVLLGFTDAARDKIATPFDERFDGVELHATLLHNILHDELLKETSPWITVLNILLLGLLIALLQLKRIRRHGPWPVAGGALALLVAQLLVSQLLFTHMGLLVELVAPIFSWFIIVTIAMTVSLMTEGQEKAELRSAFGQYLQATLVERIIRNPDRLQLGGQRRDLTVLFSDIRNFSRFSEQLEPEVLSDFLNEYLTPMTELVMDESGMLDKYIGDAVMAVYGAPLPLDDHPARACATALSMLKSLEPLNARWKARGLPNIQIGIGINSGTMSVGNMGSEARFDYTVMGDAVNLGARLEGLTKTYGVNVLVGEATAIAAGATFAFREVDRVRVLGRSAAVRVFELCGYKDDCAFSSEDFELFQAALIAYRAAKWDAAKSALQDFLKLHPEDGPAQTLSQRIEYLQQSPPTGEWDGVFEQRSK